MTSREAAKELLDCSKAARESTQRMQRRVAETIDKIDRKIADEDEFVEVTPIEPIDLLDARSDKRKR